MFYLGNQSINENIFSYGKNIISENVRPQINRKSDSLLISFGNFHPIINTKKDMTVKPVQK